MVDIPEKLGKDFNALKLHVRIKTACAVSSELDTLLRHDREEQLAQKCWVLVD